MKLKIVFIFFFPFFNAQISNNVKLLAKSLDTISYAESPHIDIDGRESKIYNYFKKLSKIANNDELYFFAKHGSNSLRIYSSQELFKRNDKRFLTIYRIYSKNPLLITYQSGCVKSKKNITQLLTDEVSATEEILTMRDELARKNKGNKLENFMKKTLIDLEENYKNLTRKDLRFYKIEMEKIDQQNSMGKLP
ncbi:hypothetical protein CEY12_09165 [Chryseobacterium sp. T16E-39]|uniref:hypothetical protein n=1 Tax=Chryseobacterium sp. T16E-39 TaxID=2015076 RepID=UPI000B5B2450|nr:hypothetical protein [Chryseobacterium sp. T16E-39]ASK30273.1 hypothetical protein CEY12_09165 [Chryseobacterium sp. T16E-39]